VLVHPVLLDTAAEGFGIAVAHSIFNILCTVLLLPMSGLLEKIAYTLIREPAKKEQVAELDERLLATPPIALERCSVVAGEMAKIASHGMKDALMSMTSCNKALADSVNECEDRCDHYEDILGTYLVKLSGSLSGHDSSEAAKLLRIIGDFERISDHSKEIMKAAEEMQEKGIVWSPSASHELEVLTHAIREIVDLTLEAFTNDDMEAAQKVEPLEQVIDSLKEALRVSHIGRLQRGECTIEAGFIWTDLLTAMQRTSDHCSNIAGCVIDIAMGNMNLHESLRAVKAGDAEYDHLHTEYTEKYRI
jgi:phosphate:Na+ symporter